MMTLEDLPIFRIVKQLYETAYESTLRIEGRIKQEYPNLSKEESEEVYDKYTRTIIVGLQRAFDM